MEMISTLRDSNWQATISDAKGLQYFFNADEDPEDPVIKKAILDVRKELDPRDDLLSWEGKLLENSRWQVMFSDNFRKSFQKLRSSSTKKLVLHLLVKLAGGWRPKKVNVDWKCEKSSYIVKQFKVDIYYVVCSIDMMRDSIYKQVLKVWDILPMTGTAKLLKQIGSIASMYRDDFISHCNKRSFERYTRTSALESKNYVEQSKVSENLLMKFYTLSCSTVNHLLSGVEGT